jgi:hypothetical protein
MKGRHDMDATTEPIIVAASISGAEVIDQLCSHIAEKLSCSGDLRHSDAYRTFSAKVTIELQLADIDQVEITE